MGEPTVVTDAETDHFSRDSLWVAAFETFYNAYFLELVASRVVASWKKVDDYTKVLVALTATGSAVAGWSVWQNSSGATVWAARAGIVAVISIIHASLGVPARLKDQLEVNRLFSGIRTDLETFRYRMAIDPNFSVKDYTAEFQKIRERFGQATQLLQYDLLATRRTEKKIQQQLNVILRDDIVKE